MHKFDRPYSGGPWRFDGAPREVTRGVMWLLFWPLRKWGKED